MFPMGAGWPPMPIISRDDYSWALNIPFEQWEYFMLHMIDSLPKTPEMRILAMNLLQLRYIKKSEKYYNDFYALERKYHYKARKIYESRKQIITGEFEPTRQWDIGPDWREVYDENELAQIESSTSYLKAVNSIEQLPCDVKGVPNYWLDIFRSIPLFSKLVQKHDEPLLKCLYDIRLKYENDSFTFHFYFTPNDLIETPPVLTKKYYLRIKAQNGNPFSFDGPEIYKCEGCTIVWRTGKDLTIEPAENVEGSSGSRVARKSFFNFFTPPSLGAAGLLGLEARNKILTADYEIGYLLRTEILPKSLLFYTGDICADFSEDELSCILERDVSYVSVTANIATADDAEFGNAYECEYDCKCDFEQSPEPAQEQEQELKTATKEVLEAVESIGDKAEVANIKKEDVPIDSFETKE